VSMPKFVIITVHLNNYEGFLKTFESVLLFLEKEQSSKWIIKDGNSTNSVLEKIQGLVKQISSKNIKFIQSSDSGIYDAMNQTLDYLDDGDTVLFLNSGDTISDDFLERFSVEGANQDILFSDTIMYQGNKRVVAPLKLDFAYLLGKTLNHQSLIIRGKWLKKHQFKTEYSIVADWIQLFEILKNEKVEVEKLAYPISIYEGGGFSELHDELRLSQRQSYLESIYSVWELESLTELKRLRQRKWFDFVIKALVSPKRSKSIELLARAIR
jgi:glycosyltransferase involved in cell wall biosynthesis